LSSSLSSLLKLLRHLLHIDDVTFLFQVFRFFLHHQKDGLHMYTFFAFSVAQASTDFADVILNQTSN